MKIMRIYKYTDILDIEVIIIFRTVSLILEHRMHSTQFIVKYLSYSYADYKSLLADSVHWLFTVGVPT